MNSEFHSMTQQIPTLVYDQEIKGPSPSPPVVFPMSTSRKFHVSSCCGCWSVRTGVIIIGILTIISSLITIIVWAINSVGYVAMFVTPVAHLIFGILMVWGARIRKSKFISPMLCIFFVDLVITIPTFSVLTIEFGVFARQTAAYYAAVFFVIGLANAFATYFFLVIKSFYRELENEKRPVVRMDENIVVQCTGVSNL